MAPNGREKGSLSFKQVLMLIAAVGSVSGAGGALTVSASDSVQDTEIENLKGGLNAVKEESSKTREEVARVGEQVKAVDDRVGDLRDDIGELRTLVIQAIGDK